MKKGFLLAGAAVLLSVSALTACGSEKEETKKEAQKDPYEEAKKLKNPEDPIVVVCDSKASNDIDKFVSAFEYMESLMKMTVNGDADEDGVNDFEAISKAYEEECGEDYTWEYEIVDKTEIEDEKKLEEYTENAQIFGGEDEVTEAYDMTADIHIEGKKGKKDYTLEVTVGKIGGKWQIINFDQSLLE